METETYHYASISPPESGISPQAVRRLVEYKMSLGDGTNAADRIGQALYKRGHRLPFVCRVIVDAMAMASLGFTGLPEIVSSEKSTMFFVHGYDITNVFRKAFVAQIPKENHTHLPQDHPVLQDALLTSIQSTSLAFRENVLQFSFPPISIAMELTPRTSTLCRIGMLHDFTLSFQKQSDGSKVRIRFLDITFSPMTRIKSTPPPQDSQQKIEQIPKEISTPPLPKETPTPPLRPVGQLRQDLLSQMVQIPEIPERGLGSVRFSPYPSRQPTPQRGLKSVVPFSPLPYYSPISPGWATAVFSPAPSPLPMSPVAVPQFSPLGNQPQRLAAPAPQLRNFPGVGPIRVSPYPVMTPQRVGLGSSPPSSRSTAAPLSPVGTPFFNFPMSPMMSPLSPFNLLESCDVGPKNFSPEGSANCVTAIESAIAPSIEVAGAASACGVEGSMLKFDPIDLGQEIDGFAFSPKSLADFEF